MSRETLLLAAVAAIALLGVLLLVLRAVGHRRWLAGARELARRVEAVTPPSPGSRFRAAELAGLPEPVVRYFRAVLPDGQAPIAVARVYWEGRFRLGASERSWRPFTATQIYSGGAPAFIWNARIRMLPGIGVRVRDTYLDGEGSMKAAVAGIVPVLDVGGAPEIAEATLQRYLAEAVWFPTALLPGAGVEWSPAGEGAEGDGSAAVATLADGDVVASVRFRFAGGGEVEEVHVPGRWRQVEDGFEAVPWSGTFGDWEERRGIRIPLSGEARWHPPEGPLPYWRGRVADVGYECLRE